MSHDISAEASWKDNGLSKVGGDIEAADKRDMMPPGNVLYTTGMSKDWK
jgi:hypothetical protein